MVGSNRVSLGYTKNATETPDYSPNREVFFYKEVDKGVDFRTQESTRGQFYFACTRCYTIGWHFFFPGADKVASQVF